jgi:hypothetical protein
MPSCAPLAIDNTGDK